MSFDFFTQIVNFGPNYSDLQLGIMGATSDEISDHMDQVIPLPLLFLSSGLHFVF
jgi:hypothetical protein